MAIEISRPSEGIGDRLKRYRHLNRFSAQQLSDKLNGAISRGVIANIESGTKKDVTVDELILLAHALDIPPAALALPIESPGVHVPVTGNADGRGLTIEYAHKMVLWFNGIDIYPEKYGVRLAHTVYTQQLRSLERLWEAQRSLRFATGDPSPDRAEEARERIAELRQELSALGIDPMGIL